MQKEQLRVLIVEDDEALAKSLQESIGRSFETEVRGTAKEALTRIGHLPPIQAILLDLNLPNGRGIELVNMFQAAAPSVPMVVLTGFNFPVDELIMAGAQDVLFKPCASAQVAETLKHSIARHKVRAIFAPVDREVNGAKELTKQSAASIDLTQRKIERVESGKEPESVQSD